MSFTMWQWRRSWIGCFLATALATAPAQAQNSHYPAGDQPRDSADHASRRSHHGKSCKPAVPVPPALEIEVLDPNVDPAGNPAVILKRELDDSNQERLVVDIPPVVLVHRYYYTGDRTFQGPSLPGGPSIVVVHHPVTGERVYIPVQMLPGAPQVTYKSNSIEYDYGPQSVTISFGHHGEPKVTHRQGVPVSKTVKQKSQETKESVCRVIDRTDLPEFSERVGQTTRNVAVNTLDTANGLARAVVTPVLQVLRVMPLVKTFAGKAEERGVQERDKFIARADAEVQRGEEYIRRER